MTVDAGEEFTVEVRCAFDGVKDISAVSTPCLDDARGLLSALGPMGPGREDSAYRGWGTIRR
jgi:hypothetical protein